MKLKAFCLLDSKSGAFGVPFFVPNKAMALRAFEGLSRDEKTLVSQYPEDFSIHLVGEFDDENGGLSACKHENLGTAVGFVNRARLERPVINLKDVVNGVETPGPSSRG